MAYQRTWETRRKGGRSVADASRDTYYGLPVVHKPHWKWLIISYFYVGGLAGASYVVASLAQLFGGAWARPITRAGLYLSFAALIPSPMLLILDLGRPERFIYMLRVLKLRSPMSVGSWVLVVFSGCCGLSTLIQAAEDGLLRWPMPVYRLLVALPARLIATLGIPFGFLMSSYTGVLVAITAVPLWAKNALLMGPLFLASAMSNAIAAITLVLALAPTTKHEPLKRLERLHLLSLLAELGLLLAARVNLGPVIGRPLRDGRIGQIYRWGVLSAGISAPLLLHIGSLFHRKRSGRSVSVLSSTLTLIGGMLLRYVIVMAGRASADDPAATFAFTRGDGETRTVG